ncbi:MAG: MFS transporter [Myxococcota bacterium]
MTEPKRTEPGFGTAILVPPPPRPASPIREVLALRSFRYYWISQFLSMLVAGTLRFTFIWLVLDLSDWAAAAGVIALAAGLPALFLSLHAGVWSDRSDRRLLVIWGSIAASVLLGLTGLAIWSGVVDLAVAIVFATLIGVAQAIYTPAVQAMVPMLVPRQRLMNAVALQSMGMQIAMFAGALVGGAAIATLGIAGAFGVLATLTLLSAVAMQQVRLPKLEATPRSSVSREVGDGLRFALGREPLRSLMLAMLLVSASFGVMQINLPEFAKESLGRGAFASSALFGAFAPGMLVSSLFLAARADSGRQGLMLAVALGLGLGTGQLLLPLARSYPVALFIMFVWGIAGGVAMTSHRSLIQSLTPNEMMGRAMGILTLGMAGAFPLSALLSALVSPRLGPDGTMMLTGALTLVIAPLIVFRKPVRTA